MKKKVGRDGGGGREKKVAVAPVGRGGGLRRRGLFF